MIERTRYKSPSPSFSTNTYLSNDLNETNEKTQCVKTQNLYRSNSAQRPLGLNKKIHNTHRNSDAGFGSDHLNETNLSGNLNLKNSKLIKSLTTKPIGAVSSSLVKFLTLPSKSLVNKTRSNSIDSDSKIKFNQSKVYSNVYYQFKSGVSIIFKLDLFLIIYLYMIFVYLI